MLSIKLFHSQHDKSSPLAIKTRLLPENKVLEGIRCRATQSQGEFEIFSWRKQVEFLKENTQKLKTTDPCVFQRESKFASLLQALTDHDTVESADERHRRCGGSSSCRTDIFKTCWQHTRYSICSPLVIFWSCLKDSVCQLISWTSYTPCLFTGSLDQVDDLTNELQDRVKRASSAKFRDVICENSGCMNLGCPDGFHLHVCSANYGRKDSSVGRCIFLANIGGEQFLKNYFIDNEMNVNTHTRKCLHKTLLRHVLSSLFIEEMQDHQMENLGTSVNISDTFLCMPKSCPRLL